jgi:hypothetical protein
MERLATQAAAAAAASAAAADAAVVAERAAADAAAARTADAAHAARKIAELEGALDAAAQQGTALDEATRQGAALRVLYAEELDRASRMAVGLGCAQQSEERARSEVAALAEALRLAEARAGHAEDGATALRAQAGQLEAALAARDAVLTATTGARVAPRGLGAWARRGDAGLTRLPCEHPLS